MDGDLAMGIFHSHGGYRLLGVLKAADLNSTGDQAVPITASRYMPQFMVVVSNSGNVSSASAGLFAGASKTDTILTTATLTQLDATDRSQVLSWTPPNARVLSASEIYFAVTAVHGSAATADVYVYGFDLSG